MMAVNQVMLECADHIKITDDGRCLFEGNTHHALAYNSATVNELDHV